MSTVIVVGCGRVGSRLANMLSDSGQDVCVIDSRPEAFTNLGNDYDGAYVLGLGFDESVLIQAGIDDCNVLAAVTQSDNTNLMCVEVAGRLFGVEHVIARLSNPGHERAYRQLGIDYVCGTSLVAEDIFSKVVSGHEAYVDSFGDFEILQFSLNLESEDNHKSIRVADLEREHEIRIIAFEREDGSASSIPNKDSVLYAGDSVLAIVQRDLVAEFSRYFFDEAIG